MEPTIDILMITCQRPGYTAIALPALLKAAENRARVWVWHNGMDAETLRVVESHLGHPAFAHFHHSEANQYVREPTNWLFKRAEGDLLGVVADDTVVDRTWIERLAEAHVQVPEFGVVAGWHFAQEDFDWERAKKKRHTFGHGYQMLVHPWVQGSGVLMKRACIKEGGLIPADEPGFTSYCIRIASRGWVNGWLLPLVPVDHMDDPRSAHSLLKSDEAVRAHLPLSAKMRGIDSVVAWEAHLRRSARIIQTAPDDPKLYMGWRKKVRRAVTRLRGAELVY